MDLTKFSHFLPEATGFRPLAGPRASADAAPAAAPATGGNAPAAGPSANVANASAPAFAPFHHGSVADRLPGRARDFLRNLESDVDAASAVSGSLFERQQEALLEKQRAEARVRELRARHALHLRDDDPALASALATAENASAEWQRLSDEMSRRSEIARPIRELLASLRSYVERDLASVATIEAAAPVAVPALKAGEQWAEAIKRQRAKIEKLHDDLQAIHDAPQPSSIAKEIATAEITALAEKGRPSVAGLIDGAREIGWPGNWRLAEVAFGQDGRPLARVGHDRREADALALAAWLHKDELIAAIHREIDDAADDASALDPATRAKKVGQFQAAVLEAERIEEGMVRAAIEAGQPIQRRPDADPRAVLGLADHMPAPRRSL